MKRYISAAVLVCQNFVHAQDPPPTLYKCHGDTFECVQCDPKAPAFCSQEEVCKASCGHFTPEELVGTWRGINVKSQKSGEFLMGEIDVVFGNSTMTETSPDGTVKKYDVATTQGGSFITKDDKGEQYAVNSVVENLKYTTAMGFSTFGNKTYPDSFRQAVLGEEATNTVLFKCNSWDKNVTCDFTPTMMRTLALNSVKPRQLAEKAAKCGRCDISEDKCRECPCGSGPACVPEEECARQCAGGFTCSWNATQPQCIRDPKGHYTKDECDTECVKAKYGKCDYKTNTCVSCTPGPDDKNCDYTMAYCQIALKEDRCKAETIGGLWRMLEVQPKYDMGEFDLLLKDGKMWIQDYTTKVEAKEMGDIKQTGTSDEGGVAFEVMNWKSDPKIWPHDKLYGYFHELFGEENIFKFIEVAFSEKPIDKLPYGLAGRYFVGVACSDDKYCDFSKAAPKPDWWLKQGQTPAVKALNFLQ